MEDREVRAGGRKLNNRDKDREAGSEETNKQPLPPSLTRSLAGDLTPTRRNNSN